MKHNKPNDSDFSTNKISETLVKKLITALKSVQSYGSVEIYVQDGVVTQITTRTIQKTSTANKKIGLSN